MSKKDYNFNSFHEGIEWKELKEILSSFDISNLKALSFSTKDFSLELEKYSSAIDLKSYQDEIEVDQNHDQNHLEALDPLDNNQKNENLFEIKTPISGVYYQAASPDEAPFVKEGDFVAKGSTLCIIETMKVMNEIKADSDAYVEKVLKKDKEFVSQNDKIFYMKKK